MTLHPEYITRGGKKEYAVLPYEEFLALQEEIEQAEDILALREARRENEAAQGISLDEMKKQLGLSA
ncbi:MAG: type II toxin-antitoxin system Phd/YefM family antitoxin [Candidatus Kapaibacterium sp.]